MTQLRYYGVSAYEIITDDGRHIWIDPFLNENPVSPVKATDIDADLVLVTHAAFDHLGDAAEIAMRTGAPVVCGGEVKAYLTAVGVPGEQVRATTWGICLEVAGVRIQPVECHHWSQIKLPDGQLVSGVPMGFVVYAGPGVRIYHYGDTGLFSDLKLIGQLYRPTVGLIGVANPTGIVDRVEGPGRMLTAEMSPREAAMAACWLGVDTVLPNHYTDPEDPDVKAFVQTLTNMSGGDVSIAVLSPGDVHTCVPRPERKDERA